MPHTITRTVTQAGYQAYINSPAWQAKRDEFFASDLKLSKRCFVCGAARRPGFHVHHRHYSSLGNEQPKDLMLLCPKHHKMLHKLHDKRRDRKGGASMGTAARKLRDAYKAKLQFARTGNVRMPIRKQLRRLWPHL